MWLKYENNYFYHSCVLLLIFLIRNSFLHLIKRSSSRFKEFSLGCLLVGSSLIWKKEKLAKKATCCTTRFHLLSLVVIRCLLSYHSLSLIVPLVVARCTTCLSFYKRSLMEVEKMMPIFILFTVNHLLVYLYKIYLFCNLSNLLSSEYTLSKILGSCNCRFVTITTFLSKKKYYLPSKK